MGIVPQNAKKVKNNMATAVKIRYSSLMKTPPQARMRNRPIRIATRSSQLALVQTQMVVERLHRMGIESQIMPIDTTGDSIRHKPLWDIGGKGLFCRQLDMALLQGACDICVHSAKDLETHMTEGIRIIGFLARADVRDVLIGATAIDRVPSGAVLGTSSPRRHAQIQTVRPDINIVPIRGNVPTRLQKCADGVVDATLLAYAGLHRLQYNMSGNTIENMPFAVLPIDVCIPAAAQGAIAITCRVDDVYAYDMVLPICHMPTYTQVMVERAVLRGIGGNCHSPIGVHAHIQDDTVCVRTFVAYADKTQYKTYKNTYPITNAVDNAFKMGQNLTRQLGHI